MLSAQCTYVCLQRYLREGATGLEFLFFITSRPYDQVKVSPQAKRIRKTRKAGKTKRQNKLLPLHLYQPHLELVTHYDLFVAVLPISVG